MPLANSWICKSGYTHACLLPNLLWGWCNSLSLVNALSSSSSTGLQHSRATRLFGMIWCDMRMIQGCSWCLAAIFKGLGFFVEFVRAGAIYASWKEQIYSRGIPLGGPAEGQALRIGPSEFSLLVSGRQTDETLQRF